MKKLVLVAMVAVLGFMFVAPSLGYCDNPWQRNQHPAQYAVARDHGPRDYRPAPVPYNYRHRDARYEEHHGDDRGGQVAVAVIGGLVVGALLGAVIAQGQ